MTVVERDDHHVDPPPPTRCGTPHPTEEGVECGLDEGHVLAGYRVHKRAIEVPDARKGNGHLWCTEFAVIHEWEDE